MGQRQFRFAFGNTPRFATAMYMWAKNIIKFAFSKLVALCSRYTPGGVDVCVCVYFRGRGAWGARACDGTCPLTSAAFVWPTTKSK